MRDSFLLFTEQRELIECLTDEQAGRLFKLLYNYAADINIKIDNDIKLAYIAIRQQIDRNNIKYDEVVEKRRANGQKGGAPLGNSNAKKNNQNNQNNQNNLMVDLVDLKTTKNNQNKQNKHNDNVNVNVNDNVNENVNENDYSFKKEKKEKSFQNSDFKENEINETNEINEINETKQPLKFADLPENLRVCGIYGNNALLEEEKREDFEKNSKMEEVCNAPPPKKNEENDPYFFYSKIRAEYENIIGKQGAYLNDTQVHDLYRLYLSTDDFMETLNDVLKELVKVQKIFKKKIGYSPGLDWIVKADGKNYTTLRNKSFTGLEEENKENEVFQITI